MRFGSRSHDTNPESNDHEHGERAQLVRLLRSLADRIEDAPKSRIAGSLATLAEAAAPLVRAVERALTSDRSKK